jgi:RNA-binding protein Musashi
MQSDSGKLFIGGISWDTNEERLKEYFSSYGEVVEAVIMKDRTTGRARGFGFVVFADPAVADRVIKEKHNIDGRMVSFDPQLYPEIYTMQYGIEVFYLNCTK